MPDRDDKAFADDQVCLAISDSLTAQLPGPQHDEEHVVVDIQFRAMMSVISIFDHQLVKPVELR